MPDKTVVGLGAILLKSWLPPRLVPGIAYAILAISSILFLVFVGHLYVVAFAVVGILAAILIFWCRSVLQYNQLRRAAVRGDATRTHIVEQSATSPDEASIEIQLKLSKWYSYLISICAVFFAGCVNYSYGIEMSKQSPALLKDFVLVAMAVVTLMLLHRTLYHINRSRFTINADLDGITTRNRWKTQHIRWQDVGLFWIQPDQAPVTAELAEEQEDNILPRYEIASSKLSLTIPWVRTDALSLLVQVDDPTTYDARMQALVAMIQHRSGVPLRAQNLGKRRPTRT